MLGQGSHRSEVLESIPLTLQAADGPLYVFIVPSENVLGESFASFENVQVRCVDANFEPVEAEGIEYFSTGSLGAFHGGLLNLDDLRVPICAEDITAIQGEQLKTRVADRRTETVRQTVVYTYEAKLGSSCLLKNL